MKPATEQERIFDRLGELSGARVDYSADDIREALDEQERSYRRAGMSATNKDRAERVWLLLFKGNGLDPAHPGTTEAGNE